jgi:hypothetical protein
MPSAGPAPSYAWPPRNDVRRRVHLSLVARTPHSYSLCEPRGQLCAHVQLANRRDVVWPSREQTVQARSEST